MRVRIGLIAVVGAVGVHALLSVGLAHLGRRGPVLSPTMFAPPKTADKAPVVPVVASPPVPVPPAAPVAAQPRKLPQHPRAPQKKPIRHVARATEAPAPPADPPPPPPVFNLDSENVEGSR